jgi:hypothetical protein
VTDVFISYKREERLQCARIAEKLRALGLDVWFDAKLESGASFDSEIETKIHEAKAVLVLWSPASVQSAWVRNEATIGSERGVMVSAELAPCRRPIQFTTTHTVPLHDPNFADDDPAWMGVVRRIGKLAGRDDLVRAAEKVLGPGGHGPSAAPPPRKNAGELTRLMLAAAAAIALAFLGFQLLRPFNAGAPQPGEVAAISTPTPQTASAPAADPCRQTRSDWAALAASKDVTLLKKFQARVPEACAIELALVESRLKELAAADVAAAEKANAADAVARAFSGSFVAVPDRSGECGRLPWRFEPAGGDGWLRISQGGDKEPFTLTGTSPPTLRHSGGLKIVARKGGQLEVIPGDERPSCLLQRE